jgi:hypothetical protein
VVPEDEVEPLAKLARKAQARTAEQDRERDMVENERAILVEVEELLVDEGPNQAGRRAMSEPLPELLDVKALRAELGVTRAAAEAIMRRLPVVQLPGLRKVYVRRSDVVWLLEESTFTKDRVPT